MTEKQRRFCELYAANPNATAAAIGAGYSPRTAKAIGSENLTKPDLQDYLQVLQKVEDTARIASVEEIKAMWTSIIRDREAKYTDRIRAGELLAKSAGVFVNAGNGDEKNAVSRVVIYLPERDPEPE